MLAMSKTDVSPGATETQQLRVMVAAPGVSLSLYTTPLSVPLKQLADLSALAFARKALVRLRLRIAYSINGAAQQDQTDFSFPAGLMA